MTETRKELKLASIGTFEMQIQEFEALMNSTEPGEGDLWSEGVMSELAPRAVWMLQVWPNGFEEQNRGSISTALHLTGPMADNEETLEVIYHLYVVGADGQIDSIKRGRRGGTMFGLGGRYGRGWHASHDRVRRALQADGSLVLAVDVSFLTPDHSGAKVISEGALRVYENRERWGVKFSEFYGDVSSSDCSIEIGGVTIPAHKLPLMACSPVFHAMFTNSAAEESKSGVVQIDDFKEPQAMRAVLRYCYQGRLDYVTMDGEWAGEIFKLADKYCIDDLKALLERHFIDEKLCVENVVDLAVLADTYFAGELKAACIELIARQSETITQRGEWERMEKEVPELAVDLAVESIRVLAFMNG